MPGEARKRGGRRVISWNMMSLDGLFEGSAPWELDWHEKVWGDELEKISLEQLEAAGALLFGRKTYEGMAAYWPNAVGRVAELMNALPKLVFSGTLKAAEWDNVRLVTGPAEDEVARLKDEPGGDLFVFGSAGLADSLRNRGLIDEYRVGLCPILLGEGTPLFKPNDERLYLTLLEARPMGDGVVVLRYAPR